jgi:hypothetical protein
MVGILLGILYATYPVLILSSVLVGKFGDGPIFSVVAVILKLFCPVAFLIVTILNIFYTKRLIKQRERKKLKKSAEIVKLASIPFWIINFLVLSLSAFAAIIATRGFGIVFLPIFILITYIALLGTSVFSISYIRLLYKEKEIGFAQMTIHIILQLCFVSDIIGIIYLKKTIPKKGIIFKDDTKVQ